MNFYLPALSDEELQYLVRMDLQFFLEPIKANQKNYMQYNSLLGNKSKKSLLVQKNLPGIAVKLYRKHDRNFVKGMEYFAERYVKLFMELVVETLGQEISEDDLTNFTNDEIANMLLEFQEKEGSELDYELLWIQMKLVGFKDVDDRKVDIKILCGEVELEENIEEDEVDGEITDNLPIRDDKSENIVKEEKKKNKQKRLSAEEKAAKNKAAVEAKEKAKKEEQIEKVQEEQEVEDPKLETKNDVKIEKSEEVNGIREEEEKTIMSRYIGVVNIKTNYYNFTPIGYVENGVYTPYTERDLDRLLPLSNKHNINFFYNYWDENHNNFMLQHFYDGQPVVLNCEIEELEENRMPDGTINPTGYKVPAIDGFQKGKIGYLSDDGLYAVIPKDVLVDDIETKKAIRINVENIMENEKVLVNLGDGFYAGPFVVRYSPTNRTFYINMQAEEGKHYITGYNHSDCIRITIEPSSDVENWIGYNSWNYYAISKNAIPVIKDVISDKELLESFKYSLSKTSDLDYSNLDIDGIIEKIGESQIVGKSLPEEITKKRIERIRKILSSEETLKQIYSDASDIICELLLRNRDSMQTEQLIEEIIAKRPDLLDKMQGLKSIQLKVDNARAELEQLEAQRSDIEAKIKDKQEKEAAVIVSKETVEEKMSQELQAKKAELDAILSKIGAAETAVELQEKIQKLKEEAQYYEKHKQHLVNDAKNLESNFVELVNGYSEKIADITFDGFMSSKMLEAATGWEAKEELAILNDKVDKFNMVESASLSDTELLDYIVKTIQISRPGYSRNTIINILTCISQGFLTVFSGLPGCGKTSICNIISQVLGLDSYDSISDELKGISRFIPVSVERGWTSKRDFIGYYNPLTKAFEESNRDVHDGLKFLDLEVKKGYKKWPFFILLDEANLSPMEYYWADFMNVCDDQTDNTSINLGNDNVFKISETLHFLATINNDHTTETLSPRLIDRAWIISLPKSSMIQYGQELQKDQLQHITWDAVKKVFVNAERKNFDRETQLIYEGLKDKLKKQDIYVSPRVDIAIQKYWTVASNLMEEDEYGNGAGIVALDYAISQKILPKIIGSGDEYESWLEELKSYCDAKNLSYTVDLISTIISRGNRQMKYYQFFN